MSRYATVIYCDDIRDEVGNKHTYVGVYRDALICSQIPALLPKLCVVLTLHTPKTRMFEKVSVVGTFDNQEAFRMELDKAELDGITGGMPPPSADTTSYELTLMATLTPFQIETIGKLKLDIRADDEVLTCASLPITSI